MPLQRGDRVRSVQTGTIGTTVWNEERDEWGAFVPVEWDGPHSLIEDVDVKELTSA